MPSDTADIIRRFRDEPAPLLPMLHAIQERDGFIGRTAIRAVGSALRLPESELYGTITFYHYFRTESPDAAHLASRPMLCSGPACRLGDWAAARDALAAHGEVMEISCPGRCDLGVCRLDHGASSEAIHERGPLPPPPRSESEECLFRHIRTPGRDTLEGYVATGGYEALTRLKSGQLGAEDVIAILKESGLAGRGGAGFPTGVKWDAVRREQRGPKSIVANADEGEPGCFKDRVLMEYDPHALIEGMALAGLTAGIASGFIYLRYEYPAALRILERAIDEAKAAGHLDGFALYIRRGAGAYICGEETSLLNSMEGKRPFPREKPPFPTTHGFNQLPTIVNNVETLAAVPPILRRGARWYKELGLGEGNAGTKIFSVSGDVVRPGNYELPFGTPLRTLLFDCAGGMRHGRRFKAATMAGVSGGFLAEQHLDTPLDERSVRAHGAMLGAGGVIVYDETRSMIEAAGHIMHFFAHESCGKCFPCRIGTERIGMMLDELGGRADRNGRDYPTEIGDVSRIMKKMSACGLGKAAPLVVDTMRAFWSDEFNDACGRTAATGATAAATAKDKRR